MLPTTPAMEAGSTDTVWSLEELVGLSGNDATSRAAQHATYSYILLDLHRRVRFDCAFRALHRYANSNIRCLANDNLRTFVLGSCFRICASDRSYSLHLGRHKIEIKSKFKTAHYVALARLAPDC